MRTQRVVPSDREGGRVRRGDIRRRTIRRRRFHGVLRPASRRRAEHRRQVLLEGRQGTRRADFHEDVRSVLDVGRGAPRRRNRIPVHVAAQAPRRSVRKRYDTVVPLGARVDSMRIRQAPQDEGLRVRQGVRQTLRRRGRPHREGEGRERERIPPLARLQASDQAAPFQRASLHLRVGRGVLLPLGQGRPGRHRVACPGDARQPVPSAASRRFHLPRVHTRRKARLERGAPDGVQSSGARMG